MERGSCGDTNAGITTVRHVGPASGQSPVDVTYLLLRHGLGLVMGFVKQVMQVMGTWAAVAQARKPASEQAHKLTLIRDPSSKLLSPSERFVDASDVPITTSSQPHFPQIKPWLKRSDRCSVARATKLCIGAERSSCALELHPSTGALELWSIGAFGAELKRASRSLSPHCRCHKRR